LQLDLSVVSSEATAVGEGDKLAIKDLDGGALDTKGVFNEVPYTVAIFIPIGLTRKKRAIESPRRAPESDAGPPGRWLIGRKRRVDESERRSLAIGALWPGRGIIVSEREKDTAITILDLESLAIVIEIPDKFPCHDDPRKVTIPESKSVCVFDENSSLASKKGEFAKGEFQTSDKLRPGKNEGPTPRVGNLQKLKVISHKPGCLFLARGGGRAVVNL
jgi:hypothetical protein